MLPKFHIISGLIFSIVLFLIFPSVGIVGIGIVFLSSFLIDIDHYVYYIFKKKDVNPKRAVNYFLTKRRKLIKMKIAERNKLYSAFCFLHGIETFVVLFILGIFVSKYFLFIFVGFALHMLLDIIQEAREGVRIDKIFIIYDWFKFKRLKFLG